MGGILPILGTDRHGVVHKLAKAVGVTMNKSVAWVRIGAGIAQVLARLPKPEKGGAK